MRVITDWARASDSARLEGKRAVRIGWLSEWPAFDDDAGKLLGLEEGERVAGFIYLGTATCDPPERPRADMAEKITRWEG